MRTTVDIDDDVLQAAKDIAAKQNNTLGQVISVLVRQSLRTGRIAPGVMADWPHSTSRSLGVQ
jgi:antitoxin component of RelBE/YafQ-DinJ toxin-antitoxin module